MPNHFPLFKILLNYFFVAVKCSILRAYDSLYNLCPLLVFFSCLYLFICVHACGCMPTMVWRWENNLRVGSLLLSCYESDLSLFAAPLYRRASSQFCLCLPFLLRRAGITDVTTALSFSHSFWGPTQVVRLAKLVLSLACLTGSSERLKSMILLPVCLPCQYFLLVHHHNLHHSF